MSALEGITELYVAKGKQTLFFDLGKQRPSAEELLGLLLGRSGKLRAPAIRIGRRLIVGYSSELLENVLL